jgi:PAS domain S-box-containing protein
MAIANDLQRADLNAVLKTALDAVVVMHLDGTVAGWNGVAERIFGWSFEEARGRRMSELIIPVQHREAHEHGLTKFLATGEGPVLDRHFEITALRRDGPEFPIELSITFTEQFEKPVFLGFLRDISERQEAHRRQELLMAELSHRVKNMLAVVTGIAHQTAKSCTSMQEFAPAFAGRLQALAHGHEILTLNSWEGAGLPELVEALLGPYAVPPDMRVTFGGPPVDLDAKQVLSLSMILHELITNATKYGALSSDEGRIAISWNWSTADRPGRLHFTWKECGLRGVVPPPKRDSFGLKMIGLSATHELGGCAGWEWRDQGLLFTLEFQAGRSPE